MTIRHLKIFVKVCQTKSITKAAKELYLAQPSVSLAIAELEKYYNVKLFSRINQRLVITDCGQKLFALAINVLDSFNTFETAAFNNINNPIISLGSSLTIGKLIIPQLLITMNKVHPNIHIETTINQSHVIEQQIIDGSLSLGLIESPTFSNNLVSIPFNQDTLVIIKGTKYNVNPSSIEELSRASLILREKGSASRDFLDNIFKEHHLTTNPTIESVCNDAIIELVRNNLGISVLPLSLVKTYIDNKSIEIINIKDIDLTRELFIIYHKNKKLSPIEEELCSYIKSI